MAITNPQAVKFANERARVFADAMVTAYEAAVKLLAEYAAQGLSAQFPDSAAETVSDGAATDGRGVITGQHVNRLIANAQAVVTYFEGGTPVRITVFRQIAVNGRSPF